MRVLYKPAPSPEGEGDTGNEFFEVLYSIKIQALSVLIQITCIHFLNKKLHKLAELGLFSGIF